MELHADLSQRAVLDSNALAWTPSPMAGVERRMLDRRGEEVARATFSEPKACRGITSSPRTSPGTQAAAVVSITCRC